MICSGCSAQIDRMAEVYGPPGDTFCLFCWIENADWIFERRRVLNDIFYIEVVMHARHWRKREAKYFRLRLKNLKSNVERLTRNIGSGGYGSYMLRRWS